MRMLIIFVLRFVLFLRLFLVMGIVWSMEAVSYFVASASPYFMLTDILNTLQGLFIFILFVLNRRVLNLVKQRFVSDEALFVLSET